MSSGSKNLVTVIDLPFRSASEKFHVLLDDLVYLTSEARVNVIRAKSTAPFDVRQIGLRRRSLFKKVHACWKNAQARILASIRQKDWRARRLRGWQGEVSAYA